MAVEAVAPTVAAEADSTVEAASVVAADPAEEAHFVEVAVVSAAAALGAVGPTAEAGTAAAALEVHGPTAEVRTAAAALGAVGPMAEVRTAVAALEARGLTVEAHIEAVHPVVPAAIRPGAGPRADWDAASALVVELQLTPASQMVISTPLAAHEAPLVALVAPALA